ncbi:hypothetical protein QFZ34_002210 [Phyllobacterium ifriqiyense]|uniref:Uncharacterized protein n=1 Tax=Phyllobacterium ifriqiyense TaxID=314238 RepID=A0ABU0SBA4_9HYPH|nr:hypothetical protein [Phyllobacterium ifriqiyense]
MYFHVSYANWQIGAIIQPGNWGRQLRQLGTVSIPIDFGFSPLSYTKTMIWESCFEAARLRIDPALPSRLDCVFLCDVQAHAEQFRNSYRQGAYVYTCDPVAPNVNQHLSDFSLMEVPNGALIDVIPPRAIQYWSNQPVGTREIIYAGSVRVTGRL